MTGGHPRRRSGPWLALILAVASVLLVATPCSATEQLRGPIYFQWGDAGAQWTGSPPNTWQQRADITGVPTRGGDTIWIAVRISSDAPTVLIPPIYTQFDAYLDGARIGGDNGPYAAARAFHLVDLPPNAKGRWLRLRIVSDYSKTGMRGAMLLGSRQALVERMLRDDVPRLALVLIFIATGIAAVGVGLAGVDRAAFLGYGGWLIAIACWTVFYSRVRDLLHPAPGFWLALWAVGLGGVGVGFVQFFRATFAPDSRWLRRLLWLNAAIAVGGIALLVGQAPSRWTNPFLAALRAIYIVEWVFVVGMTARHVRAGDSNARIYAVGIALAAAFGVRDLLLSLGLIVAANPIAHWGTLCLVIASGVVLQRRLAAVSTQRDQFAAKLADTAHERALLLRDLHDGLGRITTTISMLSSARHPERALHTIGALASEGNREIRTFMHGLDEGERRWAELEAEVQLIARQTTEAADGECTVDVRIGDAGPPSPYLCVHVLRVLAEAVTNAVKNSESPRVHVTLDVDATALRLVVTNSGVRSDDQASVGVNRGAGLKNMRSRAEELHGELNLDVDHTARTARLELMVPLPVRYDNDR